MGRRTFSFVFGRNKFIALNTNSREVGFNGTVPDIAWLRDEAQDAGNYRNVFFLSHVAPFSRDFDKNLEMQYASMVSFTPNARLSMHAHEHTFSYSNPYNDGFAYVVTGSIGKRNYVLITVRGSNVTVEEKNF